MNIFENKSSTKISLPSQTSTSPSTVLLDKDDDFDLLDTLFPDCDHLYFVDKLSDTKYPVYLVSCTKTDRLYAIKLFYWENDQPSPSYTNELRFSKIVHSNLISVVDYKEEQELYECDLDSIKVSYILMEYAKNGDFFNALITRKISFDEVLVRTYFRQLIDGIEAMHAQGAAHLDLKLENLLISDDYNLRITDFNLSYISGDSRIVSRGSKNYRAPEIYQNRCYNPSVADIYSAGIILFVMKTRGKLPFTESASLMDLGLTEVKDFSSGAFWAKKCESLGEGVSFFSEEFKELFEGMTKSNPSERMTIEKIKESKWYNMEIYSPEKVEQYMSGKISF